MSIAVVACGDEVGRDSPRLPAVVASVPGLCSDPGSLRHVGEGANGLVLLVHPRDIELSRVQAAIRRAGFDPFGVPLVDVAGAAGDPRRMDVMVSGAVARAAAFRGSRPEQARPVMAREMSRRALLTIPRPHYEALPAIDQAVCASVDGCRACVDLCPRSAYRLAGRRVLFDKDACIACGQCVTGCPTGAIENPLSSAAAVSAQVRAIIGAAEATGIVFSCELSTAPVTTPGWHQIAVPCSGMVPGTWPVAAVLLGAAAATIRACSEGGCTLGFDERSAAAVTFGRRLAADAGLDPAVIPDRMGELPAAAAGVPSPLSDPFGLHGPAEVLMALAAGRESLQVAAEVAPLGVIAVDPDACTLCTMCAETCPTGALAHGYEGSTMILSFDAASCTACAQCLPVCPESEHEAITLHRAADSAAVARGRTVVQKTETVACESCGRPIAPAATLDRIAVLLGEEHAETARYLATRCVGCRGVA